MSEFHGDLLIGGMTLKNLSGTLEEEASAESALWRGELSIEPQQSQLLESGRPYRLEFEDGRAGKIVILKVNRIDGRQTLQAVFNGLTAMENGRRMELRREAASARD